MSTIVVANLPSIVGEAGAPLSIAQPNITGIRFVRSLASVWTNHGYLVDFLDRPTRQWIDEHGLPTPQWMAEGGHSPAAVVNDMLARRGDRCALYIDSKTDHFDDFISMGIPVVLFHAGAWAVGDWRPKSSWSPPVVDNEPSIFDAEEPHTAAEWAAMEGCKTLDYDGWRIDGKSPDEPISFDEWERRKSLSTIDLRGGAR